MNFQAFLATITPPDYKKELLVKNQKATDIVKNILIAEKENRKFAPALKTISNNTNKRLIANDAWHFVKKNIRYDKESEKEQYIKNINVALYDGYGDCKTYSCLLAGIMKAFNIPFQFKLVSYRVDPNPTHIYLVAYTPEPFILDCCATAPNTETDYKKHYYVNPLK